MVFMWRAVPDKIQLALGGLPGALHLPSVVKKGCVSKTQSMVEQFST